MRENIRLRLYGLGFLGMMLLFLFLGINATRLDTQILGFVTSGIWLIAFLISQYQVYKKETKEA